MIGLLIYLPSLLTGILFFELNQLLSRRFFIVDLVLGAKILRGFSSSCKLFKKLLLVFIEANMSERCLIEYKVVCCFIFL